MTPPPKARVSDARETLERKRDYLEGFLSQKPAQAAGARARRRSLRSGDRGAEGDLRPRNPGQHLRSRPDLRRRDHARASCQGEDDSDHAALPGRRIDARRGRASGRRGAGDRRRRGRAGLGSALGPAEDDRTKPGSNWECYDDRDQDPRAPRRRDPHPRRRGPHRRPDGEGAGRRRSGSSCRRRGAAARALLIRSIM